MPARKLKEYLEREHVPAALELGLGIVPWSPLASGLLTGKYTRAGKRTAAQGEGRLQVVQTMGNPAFDKLFTERTWIWDHCYLEEALTIVAGSGKYMIRGELVQPCTASLTLTNWRVDHGPGRITHSGELEIFDENT